MTLTQGKRSGLDGKMETSTVTKGPRVPAPTNTYETNIIKVYDQRTLEEQEQGTSWYRDAQQLCQNIADVYSLPLHVVVGVCAALSPTNRWENNIANTDAMCKAFTEGGYMEEVSVCTYNKMKEKAWSILEVTPVKGIEDEWFVAEILKGPKITDFYWCILGTYTCVIDGHAWCIANDDRRTMQEVPHIGKKLRQELQAAYQEAGAKVGLTAYQMQAVTWVAWKRIHNI